MIARRRRKTPEQDLQKAVAGYLRLALRPPTIWTAIGHGGGGALRGAILKGMGLRPGFPDILIMWPHGDQPRVLGIELKAKKGRMSPDQLGMFDAFTSALCTYVLCRSLEDVAKSLDGFEVPHRKVNIWPARLS